MSWKIERIEPIPESTVVRPATGGKTFTYANMRWRLYERDGGETRIREVDGPPIYAHEHGDLAVLMRVIAEAIAPLSRRLLVIGSGYEVDDPPF